MADFLILCPKLGNSTMNSRPYCVKLLRLLHTLSVPTAVTAQALTGKSADHARGGSSIVVHGSKPVGSASAGGLRRPAGGARGQGARRGRTAIQRLQHDVAGILQDVYQLVHPVVPHEELQWIFNIIQKTPYEGATPPLLLYLVYIYFIILDERHGKFDVDTARVEHDKPRAGGPPTRICLVPTGLNDAFLIPSSRDAPGTNYADERRARHVRAGGGPFILRMASAHWRQNASGGSASGAGDCISTIGHLISNMELHNSLIACLWAGWWVFAKRLDVTSNSSITRFCQAHLEHEFKLQGRPAPPVTHFLKRKLLNSALHAKGDGHAINLHMLYNWPEKNVEKGEQQTPNVMKFMNSILLQPGSLHSHSRGADTSRIFGPSLHRVEALHAFFCDFFDLVVINTEATRSAGSTKGTGIGEDTWLVPNYRSQEDICKMPNPHMDSFEDMVQTASKLAALQPDTFILQRRTETEESFVGFETPREFFHFLEQTLCLNDAQLQVVRLLVFACGAQRDCAVEETRSRKVSHFDSGGAFAKVDVEIPWALQRLRGCTCPSHTSTVVSAAPHDSQAALLSRSNPDPWTLKDLGWTWYLDIDSSASDSRAATPVLPVCLRPQNLADTFIMATALRIHVAVTEEDAHTEAEGHIKYIRRKAKWKLETELLELFARLAGSPQKALGLYAFLGGGKAVPQSASRSSGDALQQGLSFLFLPDVYANLEWKQRLASRHNKQPQGFQDEEPTSDGEFVLADFSVDVCTAQLALFRALLRFATDSPTMDFFVANARGPRPGDVSSRSQSKSRKKNKDVASKSNAPTNMLVVHEEDNINDPRWCWPKLLSKLALTEIQCIRVQGEALKTLATIAQCHVKGQDFAWVDLIFSSIDNKKTRGFKLISPTTLDVGGTTGVIEMSIRGRLQQIEKPLGSYYYLTGFLSLMLALVESIPDHQAHERLRCLGNDWRESNQGFYPYLYFVLEVLFAHRATHLSRPHCFDFQPETRWQRWQITALCLGIIRSVLQKYEGDPNMQQDFVDMRAAHRSNETHSHASSARDNKDGGADGDAGKLLNEFAPWEYQAHSPSSAFDIMWLLTVPQTVHGNVVKGPNPPLLGLIYQVLDDVVDNDAMNEFKVRDDEFRCWPMRAVEESMQILAVASSVHGAFEDAHDAVRARCEQRETEREEQLGHTSSAASFVGLGLGAIASSNLSITVATTGPTIFLDNRQGGVRIENPRRQRHAAKGDTHRATRSRARGAGGSSRVSAQAAQRQQQIASQQQAIEIQASAHQYLIPMRVEFKRLEDTLDLPRLLQLARLVTWPEEPEGSSLQIEWCVCNVYNHQVAAASLLRSVHKIKQDRASFSRRRRDGADPFLAMLAQTDPTTVPLLARKIAALAGSERYRPQGTRFFCSAIEDAANITTFRPWSRREQELKKYELSFSLMSLILESLYCFPHQQGPVPKLAHALLGLAPTLRQRPEQRQKMAFPLANQCLFQILASMVQATEQMMTSRPETMRHFALLAQLVALLSSQNATKDFFPSFLLRANDNEVLEALQIFCRPHEDVLHHFFDPDPETAPMKPTRLQLLNNDARTEQYVRMLVHFLEGSNWAVRYLATEVFELIGAGNAGQRQQSGQRHLGAGFQLLVQDVAGLQRADQEGAFGDATDFTFTHTLQKLSWYSTRRRKASLVGATVQFYGDLHRQMLDSDLEVYKETNRDREGQLLVVQYNQSVAGKAQKHDENHIVAVSRSMMVNVAVPLDELAFGLDWVITDFTFVDLERRRGMNEPETDAWPLDGPDESPTKPWKNRDRSPQALAKARPERFIIKRQSRRVAGEIPQVTTYYDADVASLIKLAETAQLPNRSEYILMRHPSYPGAPDAGRADNVEAPCGETSFGLQLDLQSALLREARVPFVSPLRAIATAADAAMGNNMKSESVPVIPFYCASAFEDPGRASWSQRAYGSTGMESLLGRSTFYGSAGPKFHGRKVGAASSDYRNFSFSRYGSTEGVFDSIQMRQPSALGQHSDFLSQVLDIEARVHQRGDNAESQSRATRGRSSTRQKSALGLGIETPLPPVDWSVGIDGASGQVGGSDESERIAGRFHLGRLLTVFKRRLRQWCSDGGGSSAASGRGGGQWPYLRELLNPEHTDDWVTLKRCATIYNLGEELAEAQANLVTASRELITLYLNVDPSHTGVATAKILLRKTLFYLHRLYMQGAAAAVERGVDANLARLAAACIDHALHHMANNNGASGSSSGDAVVEFALEAIPMLVVCLVPYQKPELRNFWCNGFASTHDTEDNDHCLGPRQSDLLLHMRHGQVTSVEARHSMYVALQQSLRAAVPDDEDLQNGAFSLELRRQRAARMKVYKLLRDTNDALYKQLLDDALTGPVAYRSCALVTLSQLFQCDHSEHWVIYLRDGGHLVTMLSQLANMLAILWYPNGNVQPSPSQEVQNDLDAQARTFPQAARAESAEVYSRLRNPLAAQITPANRSAWVENAVALVYLLLALAQQRVQTFPSGNEDNPDTGVSSFEVEEVSNENCVRTMIQLGLFDSLAGVDPSTAHLRRSQSDDFASNGRAASAHLWASGGGSFSWAGKKNVRRITRGVLRLFCAVAQIVPCPAQPQVLLKPSMFLLKKRYELSLKSTVKHFLDFAKKRRLLMTTQPFTRRRRMAPSTTRTAHPPTHYHAKGMDDVHMLTTTLMVVAQMFHHVPPGYGSSTETKGGFSWAEANSLMRELQWLTLRLFKAFHMYSLGRIRSDEYLETSTPAHRHEKRDVVDTIVIEFEILRNLLLFCLYRQSTEAATAAALSLHRLAHPWFKPGTMEEDERRVLFRQPEFSDSEYFIDESSRDGSLGVGGLQSFGYRNSDVGPQPMDLQSEHAANMAASGSASVSFSLASIENVIVRSSEKLVLRRTEGAHAAVESTGGPFAEKWRRCEAEIVRCIGIALAIYVAHMRFFDESLNHHLRFPSKRLSSHAAAAATPDSNSIEKVRTSASFY